MRHLKTLALAAVAAGALMALVGAGTASASILCSTTVETCQEAQKLQFNTILDFSLSPGTSALLKETAVEGGATLDTCKSSTKKGIITSVGSSTETVTGEFTEVTWGTCTFPTSTTLKGKFEVHKIAGTSNGTVTADGETRVTINTIFFGSCVYSVPSGGSIGDLTEGNPAILHTNAVAHKTTGSEAVCPTTAITTATYVLTSPAGTTVSVGSG
jgi:hypothetical protein